jgi:predicted RNA-binding protein with TRAM domain
MQMSYNRDRSYGRGRDYRRGRKKNYESDTTRRTENRKERAKPVEIGKIYEVDINEITGKGDGIARVQGLIVFIENGKMGNNVKIKVTEVADRFAKATIEA